MIDTSDKLVAILLLAGFVLFALGMLGACLRWGPRRGSWNQPAAALARPGRRMFWSMYGVAILHVLAGVGLAIFVPGGGVAIFLVLLGMATFYAIAAHSWSLGMRVAHRVPRGVGRPPVTGTD